MKRFLLLMTFSMLLISCEKEIKPTPEDKFVPNLEQQNPSLIAPCNKEVKISFEPLYGTTPVTQVYAFKNDVTLTDSTEVGCPLYLTLEIDSVYTFKYKDLTGTYINLYSGMNPWFSFYTNTGGIAYGTDYYSSGSKQMAIVDNDSIQCPDADFTMWIHQQ